MSSIITLVLGVVGGFLFHTISMKISFKKRTIDNKIVAFDNIITSWVKMRNHIYSDSNTNAQIFDQIYGESQRFIGQSILVCEDKKLIEDINNLNEKLYRTEWSKIYKNEEMENIKIEAIEIINRIRENIKDSTVLNYSDFSHILSGLSRKK